MQARCGCAVHQPACWLGHTKCLDGITLALRTRAVVRTAAHCVAYSWLVFWWTSRVMKGQIFLAAAHLGRLRVRVDLPQWAMHGCFKTAQCLYFEDSFKLPHHYFVAHPIIVVQAGMEPWDVTMSDLLNGRASLDSFRGIIFVGGFSYADTLDSAKGWSGEAWCLVCSLSCSVPVLVQCKVLCILMEQDAGHVCCDVPWPPFPWVCLTVWAPTMQVCLEVCCLKQDDCAPAPLQPECQVPASLDLFIWFQSSSILHLSAWSAAAIRFNERLLEQFKAFYAREDTWSLGICNGCQLMALLGWVPASNQTPLPDMQQPRFVHNKSGRFESRWGTNCRGGALYWGSCLASLSKFLPHLLRCEEASVLLVVGMEHLGFWSGDLFEWMVSSCALWRTPILC